MADATVPPSKPRFRLSLTQQIIIGLVLGILTGLFFGERAAVLQVLGDAFIKLLQMTILPYIVASLIANIGGLDPTRAKVLGVRIGYCLLAFWGLAMLTIALMPLALPMMESANFFSASTIEPREQIDFLNLYIPANPFGSLANQVVPAAVLFSICVGIALITIPNKSGLIDQLQVFSKALVKISGFVAKLTPIGVFALVAAASGTFTIAELGKLQAYILMHAGGSLLLAFVILPAVVASLTPYRFSDIMAATRDGLIVALTTANVFIALPLLIEGAKRVIERHNADKPEAAESIDVALPIAFSFPNIGKMMMMIYVPFAAWFAGTPLGAEDYPVMLGAGVLSFFGSVTIAIPFLLDLLRIPADLFNLFMVCNVIDGRIASAGAVMHLMCLGFLIAAYTAGRLHFKPMAVLRGLLIPAAALILVIVGLRVYLNTVLDADYAGDQLVRELRTRNETADLRIVLHDPDESVQEITSLAQIRERQTLRVAVNDQRLPWSYRNADGNLVGLDIDLMNLLADDLGVTVEYRLIEAEQALGVLRQGQADISQSMAQTPPNLLDYQLSDSFIDTTLAFLVPDHQRKQFRDQAWIRNTPLTICVAEPYYEEKLAAKLPKSIIVHTDHIEDFITGKVQANAMLVAAEPAAAWTLLHPQFSVVVPDGLRVAVPICFGMSGDPELRTFLNSWLELRDKDGSIKRLNDYWLYGSEAGKRQRRWSIMEDVLGWGLTEQAKKEQQQQEVAQEEPAPTTVKPPGAGQDQAGAEDKPVIDSEPARQDAPGSTPEPAEQAAD